MSHVFYVIWMTVVFERKWPPKGMVVLRGVAFLEWVWSCRNKCVTMEVGCEVSHVLKPYPVRQYTFCCLCDKT